MEVSEVTLNFFGLSNEEYNNLIGMRGPSGPSCEGGSEGDLG